MMVCGGVGLGSAPRPWLVRYRGGSWQVLRHIPRARGPADGLWLVGGARYEPFLRAPSVLAAYGLVRALDEVTGAFPRVVDRDG